MKKILFLFIFMGLIPVGCFCPEVKNNFISINGLYVSPILNSDYTPNIVSVKKDDTLGFEVFTNYNYVAEATPPNLVFGNMLHATSCPHEGEYGLKYQIDSLIIESDQWFNGLAPGNSLNSFFRSAYYGSDLVTGEVELLINHFNNSAVFIPSGELYLNANPLDSLTHTFTFKIYMENQQVYSTDFGPVDFLH